MSLAPAASFQAGLLTPKEVAECESADKIYDILMKGGRSDKVRVCVCVCVCVSGAESLSCRDVGLVLRRRRNLEV
jgi:hypothetical protein